MKACKPSVEFLNRRDVPSLLMPAAYVSPPPAVVLPPAVPPYQPGPQTLIPNIFDEEPEQLLPHYANPPQLTPQLPTGPDYMFSPFQYPIPGQAIPPAVPLGRPQPIPGVSTPPATP